jgi:hypothetical protein
VTPIEHLLRETLAHPPVAAEPPADPVGTLARRVRALRRRRRAMLAGTVGTLVVLAATGVVLSDSMPMPSGVAGGGAQAMSVSTASPVVTAAATSSSAPSGLVAYDVLPPSPVQARAVAILRSNPGGQLDGPAEWVETSYQDARVVIGFGDGRAAGDVYVLQLRGTFDCLCPGPRTGEPKVVHAITEYVPTTADQQAARPPGAGSRTLAAHDLSRLGEVHHFTVTL